MHGDRRGRIPPNFSPVGTSGVATAPADPAVQGGPGVQRGPLPTR
jgi:hypothetical protein